MQNGEKLYLDAALDVIARQEQRGAMETDEREGLVREYLETLLPEEWDKMELSERRGFLCLLYTSGSCNCKTCLRTTCLT